MSLGSENFTGSDEDANAFAFAEIVMMLIESKANDKTAPVFKLADLIRMYQTRLEQLDAPAAGKVNSTRLKKDFWHRYLVFRLSKVDEISFWHLTKILVLLLGKLATGTLTRMPCI